MAKTNKPSTKSKLPLKDSSSYATFKNMQSWRTHEVSGAYLEMVCQKIIDWAKKEDSFCFTQFLREEGIPERTFYGWLPKFSDLQDVYWFAMSSLGDRREIGAITRKYDSGIIEKSLAVYSSTFAAAKGYDAKLKREEQGSSSEDLRDCVMKLVEQKWGDEDNTGTTTETTTVPTKTVSE